MKDDERDGSQPLSPSSAVEFVWLVNASGGQSYYLGFVKKPLESPVWYSYPGQTSSSENGVTIAQPSIRARYVEANGILQQQQVTTTYNALGNVTTITDPVGRQVINVNAGPIV